MDITNIALAISDQRKHFWQWDTGRKLKVTGLAEGAQIHFHRAGMEQPFTLLVYADGSDLVCDVPDELLQEAKTFAAYTYITDAYGSLTRTSKTFVVEERPKPSGYVYTPTEIRTWEQLDERVTKLENTKPIGSYNDLTDTPVYDKTRKITWDGNIDNVLQKIVSADGKYGLVRISDEYLSTKEVMACSLKVVDYDSPNYIPEYFMTFADYSSVIRHAKPWEFQDSETWYLRTSGSTWGNPSGVGGYYYFILSVHSTEDSSLDGQFEHSTFQKGLYFGYLYNSDGTTLNEYIKELIFPENIKTLDNKFLDLGNNATIKALTARITALENK